LMVLFGFVAVALLYRNRSNLSALSLVLGTLAKSAMAPVLFFLAVRRMPRLRERHYALACVFGAVLGGFALWVTPSLLQAIDVPLQGVDVAKRLSNSVPSVLFSAAGLAGPTVALAAYRIYWTLSVAGVAAFMIYAGRRTATTQDVVEHSLRALLLMVIVFSPNLQPWYFLWLLPFAGFSESEPLRRLVVFASAGFMLRYVVPLPPPTCLMAIGLWFWLLTILRSERFHARPTAQPVGAAWVPDEIR
jgi:hypothetical protein